MKENKDQNIEELKKRVEELETEKVELENNWKRALADYRNLVKRTEEERASYADFSCSLTVSRLLPILDNMEIMSKHISDDGLKMIVKEFKTFFEQEGVTEIEAKGKDFDSLTMEAIEMVPGEKNKVVEILNKGYLLKNKLIRPTRVKVGNGEER